LTLPAKQGEIGRMEFDPTIERLNYDSHKRDESILWQVYVLELQDGYYYIGIAVNVSERFQAHLMGEGANFTRLHKPISIREQFCSGTCDPKKAKKMENKKTLEYAVKYGGDKVKGGRYFNPSRLIRTVERLKRENAHFSSQENLKSL
jgi:predicted GIY-YIG superfamily endonuclease